MKKNINILRAILISIIFFAMPLAWVKIQDNKILNIYTPLAKYPHENNIVSNYLYISQLSKNYEKNNYEQIEIEDINFLLEDVNKITELQLDWLEDPQTIFNVINYSPYKKDYSAFNDYYSCLASTGIIDKILTLSCSYTTNATSAESTSEFYAVKFIEYLEFDINGFLKLTRYQQTSEDITIYYSANFNILIYAVQHISGLPFEDGSTGIRLSIEASYCTPEMLKSMEGIIYE